MRIEFDKNVGYIGYPALELVKTRHPGQDFLKNQLDADHILVSLNRIDRTRNGVHQNMDCGAFSPLLFFLTMIARF